MQNKNDHFQIIAFQINIWKKYVWIPSLPLGDMITGILIFPQTLGFLYPLIILIAFWMQFTLFLPRTNTIFKMWFEHLISFNILFLSVKSFMILILSCSLLRNSSNFVSYINLMSMIYKSLARYWTIPAGD